MHLSAPTVMSAPPSIDAYDAQMLDFSSDPDVAMNITGSAEIFAEALMDHDGHLAMSAYGEHPSIEVDMEEYAGDNAEYEMADETTEYHRSHGDELLDIEVYDASHAPSPLALPRPLQPSVDVPIDSENPIPTPPALSAPPPHPGFQREPESGAHPAPLDPLTSDTPHVGPLASGDGVLPDAVTSELAHPTEAPVESTLPVSESREPLGDTISTNGQSFETLTPAGAVDDVELRVPPLAEEHHVDSEPQHEASEPPIAESAPLARAAEAYDSGLPLSQDERAADLAPAAEGEAVDPLHISDGVYIDSPPAVFLSITDLSQPEFVLFNQPHVEGGLSGKPPHNREAFSLLLENRPTLYYEALSNVFETLRQDEALLSRIPHSFEGELVLDAYDLQLTVSEDNVHSREISLHDLNILHDGSNFVGSLRLRLRAVVPRFIIRYYALQEQIQRLNVAGETGEGEREGEHEEQYDASEEHRLPQQDVAVTSTHAAVVEGLETPLITEEKEDLAKEPEGVSEPIEEVPRESDETEDTARVQEPATEYREVAGEATHDLEDEVDYEGTNVGDEDEALKSENPDTDEVHDTVAEDTDAAATVTEHGSEFGGEQTEYLDYVQSEEYDERYGEGLLERAGGASPGQYGEPPYYGEEGEQDTSTAIDETLAILPGEEEEEKSVITPVPSRAHLEPELSEPSGNNVDESILPKQDVSTLSNEELTTSESTNKVTHEQASVRLGTDTTRTKICSETDESDPNFVSVLRREADVEPDRTPNAERSEQEGSNEAALRHDPNWDEWDDEDAEGEDEDDWIDPDAVSNESSVTLSSKASSKRGYDEVDPSEEVYVEDPDVSPGPKRPRVQ